MKERAIMEQVKVAELMAQSTYAEQKFKMEYEKKRLEMKEEVAKAQARANVLNKIDQMQTLELEEDNRPKIRSKPLEAPLDDFQRLNMDHNLWAAEATKNGEVFQPGQKFHNKPSHVYEAG